MNIIFLNTKQIEALKIGLKVTKWTIYSPRNKEFYDKNLSEYKDLCKKLSDTLEDLTGIEYG